MSENKFEQAVFRIFELTHLGQLSWSKERVPEPLRQGMNPISRYFEAEYQGRRLALFNERFYVPPPDEKRPGWAFFGALNARLAEPGWHERVVLALLDEDGEISFKFPTIRETQALMDAVCFKASNVDQFVNVLLNKEPSKA